MLTFDIIEEKRTNGCKTIKISNMRGVYVDSTGKKGEFFGIADTCYVVRLDNEKEARAWLVGQAKSRDIPRTLEVQLVNGKFITS